MRTVRRATAVAAVGLLLGGWVPPASAEVDLGGQPVDGSTNPAEPTEIVAGLWTTSLGLQAQAQYFTYERQVQDSTIHVGVMGAPQNPDGDGLELSASVPGTDDPSPVDCGGDYDTSASSTPHAVIGAAEVVGDESDECREAALVTIMVRRYSSSSAGELPVGIKVVEEAPVSDPGERLPEDSELTIQPPDPVEPADEPQGAESFDDAPVVDASSGPVTIAAEVTEGTEELWRVPLDWGDRLAVSADLAATEDEELASTTVQLHLVQPSRDVFDPTAGDDYSYADFGPEDERAVVGTYPLRYENRVDDLLPTLPGDHWVSLSVEGPDEGVAAVDVPVELTLEVTSTDAAPPTYQDAVIGQGGDAGPEGYSPEVPYLVGDGEFAADASGNPFTPDDADDEWWGARRAAGLGLGVVSVACCVAGAVWLRSRRTNRAAASR